MREVEIKYQNEDKIEYTLCCWLLCVFVVVVCFGEVYFRESVLQ